MPIYEYKCEVCEHVFEEWQKDFKEREVNCPQCGGKAKRLISHTSFILKGSGWYVTDYKRSKSSTSGNGNGKGNGSKPKDTSSTSKTASSSTQDAKTT
jgi:putative FmdB family regulatory protein